MQMTDDLPEWATRLRSERLARGWGKREMARKLLRAVGIAEGRVDSVARQITWWENGKHFPRDWADAYCKAFGLSRRELFGTPNATENQPSGTVTAETTRRMQRMTPARVEQILDHLDETWHLLVRTDNLLGPRHALSGVQLQLDALTPLMKVARPPQRAAALRLGARYAESAAWLHEDAGNLAASRLWTGQAMEWAVEAGDHHMVAWVLFRRSQQATTPAEMLGLADAAAREQRGEPTPMRAAILQQTAHGLAWDADEAACHRTLDLAHHFAAHDDLGDASSGHGSFCSDAYLEMQRGACWRRLGHPDRAVPVLRGAVDNLPAAYQRDRGVAYAGLAAALLATGEPEAAARQAAHALTIADDAGSARIMSMVTTVAEGLTPHRTLEPVAEVLAHLAEIQGT